MLKTNSNIAQTFVNQKIYSIVKIDTMKKTQFNRALTLVILGGLVACNPLKKMSENAENVQYSVNPNPLELHGEKVAMNVTGKIPPEYFHKKAVVEVTPVLKTVGTNPEPIQEFKTITLVGEAATAEGQKITAASGGSFKYEDEIEFKDAMTYSSLEAKVVGVFKGKKKEFGTFPIGNGTKITPRLVMADEKPILGDDNFVKVIPKNLDLQINYLVNSSQVRGSELSDDDYKAFKSFLKEGKEKEWVFKGVKVSAYASPDGEISLNENLANDRAKTAKKAVESDFRRAKIDAAKADEFYSLEGKGEDWAGFKTKMQASDIKDKALILRVLEMTTDLNQREQEIKKLAATYTEVAEKVLPELRRSAITVMAEEQARTDEEITNLVKSAPEELSIEEILYAATLTDDLNEKLSIYQTAKKVYPNDWRGHNNVGYILLLQNKANEAKAEFEAALNAEEGNKVVSNNLGICHKLAGDISKAKELYSAASGAGSEVDYNSGIIDIMEGNYSSATTKLGSYKSFNTALAQLLSGNNEGAIKTIDASDEKDLALAYYLKAVAGARTANKDLTINNLKTAFSKDASLKKRAMKDVEFLKMAEDQDFKNLF